jgi:hypothetical protein
VPMIKLVPRPASKRSTAVDTRHIVVRVVWLNMLQMLEAWSVLQVPRREGRSIVHVSSACSQLLLG